MTVKEPDAYYGEPKKKSTMPLFVDEARALHTQRIVNSVAALVAMGIVVEIGARVLRNVDINVQISGQERRGKSAASLRGHSPRRIAKRTE
jgi:hypothetical protein